MQAAPLFVDTRLEEIRRRLLTHYGQLPEREVWDPLKQFVYSLLSSRTKTAGYPSGGAVARGTLR
jgi:endonuclease-3